MTNSELIAWNHGRKVRQWFMANPDGPRWPPDPSEVPLEATETAAKARLGPDDWDRWVQRGIWDQTRPSEP